MTRFHKFLLFFCSAAVAIAKPAPIISSIAALSQVSDFGIPADVTFEDRIAFLKELQISDLMPKNLSDFMNAEINEGYGQRVYQTLKDVLDGHTERESTDLTLCCEGDFEQFLLKYAGLSLQTKGFLKMVIEENAKLDDKNVSDVLAMLERVKKAALELANDSKTLNELLKAFNKGESKD